MSAALAWGLLGLFCQATGFFFAVALGYALERAEKEDVGGARLYISCIFLGLAAACFVMAGAEL